VSSIFPYVHSSTDTYPQCLLPDEVLKSCFFKVVNVIGTNTQADTILHKSYEHRGIY
jgi:hypothetical protein